MSSRVLPPDDARAVAAVSWARMQTGGEQPAGAGEQTRSDWERAAAQMKQQCEQRVKEAHGAGFYEGETSARARAAAEVQPVVERMARAIDDLAQFRGRMRREAEGDMLQLAFAIARRVLRRELAADPEAMHGLVLAALEKLQGQEICRVKVHPSHAAQVGGYLRQGAGGATLEIIPDPSRELGGILFETDRGNLDASVDTQLREIERGLTDHLRKHT